MDNKSIWPAGILGIVLLVLVLGGYGYFIRPEATKAYSQFPTSGVFIAAIIGITLVTLTLLVMQAWITISEQKQQEGSAGHTLNEQIKGHVSGQVAEKIGEIKISLQKLVENETKERNKAIKAQLFPRHKARIDYLLKVQEAHRTVTEEYDKGKLVKRTSGVTQVTVKDELMKLLRQEPEALDNHIEKIQQIIDAIPEKTGQPVQAPEQPKPDSKTKN